MFLISWLVFPSKLADNLFEQIWISEKWTRTFVAEKNDSKSRRVLDNADINGNLYSDT